MAAKRSGAESEFSEKKAKVDPLVVTEEERAFFRKHGFLTKLNVVPAEECEDAQARFEDALRVLDPSFSKDVNGSVKCRTPKHSHGIQEMPKLAFLECVKDIRLHPNVAEVWRSLLRTKDISSSWDRINYLPSFVSDARSKPWHHVDTGPGFEAEGYVPTQSYVQVSKTSNDEFGRPSLTSKQPTGNGPDCDGSACIVVWEYSHLAHARYFEKRGITKLKRANWQVYDPETIAEWEKDGKSYISDADLARFFPGEEKVPMRRLEVRAPRGSMTFWYSATAHQSCTGKHVTNGCVFDGSADPRFVVYAAYIPRHLVTKKDADKFRQAMKEMRCTSHWPGAGQVTLFAKTPHLYSKEAVEDYKALEARLDVPLLQFDARERELVPV